MTTITSKNAAPYMVAVAVTLLGAGCGPKEEPDVVVVPPAKNTVVIENTVEVPVANKATNVVVKPGGKQQTTVVNKSTTTVVVATPKPGLPAPAPQPTRKATVKTVPTASWKPAPPPPPGPRMGSAPPRVAKAPPSFTKITPKPAAPVAGKTTAPAKAAPLVVQGQIVAVSKVPDINNVPYQEALLLVKYKVLSIEKGEYKEKELMAAHWGMQKKKLLPAARYKAGETQRLELIPMSDRSDLERIMKWDTINDFDLLPYFVAKVG